MRQLDRGDLEARRRGDPPDAAVATLRATERPDGITAAFAPDGRLAWSGYARRILVAANPQEDAEAATVKLGHRYLARTLAFSPDGARLASTSAQEGFVWDPASSTEQPIASFGTRGSWGSMAWTPDGSTILTATGSSEVTRWDAATGVATEPIATPWSEGAVSSVGCGPDPDETAGAPLIAAGTASGAVLVRRGTGAFQLVGRHDDSVIEIVVAASGRLVVSGSHDGTILVWDVSGRESPRRICPVDAANEAATRDGGPLLSVSEWHRALTGIAVTTHGRLTAAATGHGPVVIVRTADGGAIRVLDAPSHPGRVAWSHDGCFIAHASGALRIHG